ncbi:MAG: tRNA-intron lyase [Candidatus Altiarchaeales archaeon ex4484_96]|nr:MAG: tRNA-intron lyase [Candidatus Altiarchaeales archaeon ex4484_96]
MSKTGLLSGSKVVVVDNELKGFLRDKGFGQAQRSGQQLSLIEALYLVEKDTLGVGDGKVKLGFRDLVERGNKIEADFYSKYLVYRDLRERGLLVRTGLKFGADFRVYGRGVSIKTGHSDYLVHVVPEEYTCSFPELARAVRLSANVNKHMVYALVDGEGDITYYRVDRLKL